GLNSGDVLYRTIASDLGLEIDVVGPVVHVAARMEQLAPPGSVYLTGETQALTQGLIEMRSVGPLDVRGTSAPIETYEATGASMYVSRWQASSTRERAPFVGRAAERATLETALGRTIPYHALASALRDLFRVAESDDARRVRERVATLLAELDPSLASDASVLASVISLSS